MVPTHLLRVTTLNNMINTQGKNAATMYQIMPITHFFYREWPSWFLAIQCVE